MCALLLVGVACAFGMVGHVQPSMKSVRRMKEFEDVIVVSNHTEHKDMIVSQDNHALSLHR